MDAGGPPGGWPPRPSHKAPRYHQADRLQSPPPGRRTTRFRRRRRCRLLAATVAVALAATVVLAAGGYGYAHWRFGQIASVDLPGLTKPPKPGGPQVVLVVGSDSRAELDQPGDAARFGTTQDAGGVRADVIMLLRVDPAAHTAKILSVPRDLLVPLGSSGRRGKVNAAFAGGPAQLVQTVQAQLGVPVHHYLLVNFDGFRAIVDALGGISLDFPYPARDALAGLHVTRAGCQHLDGGQALAVARARHYRYLQGGRWHADPLSDLGRIQRQQTFLRVVLQTAIAKGLTNPVRANQFAGAVVGSLTKDRYLTVAGAVGLARQFGGFNAAGLRTQTLPTVAANHYQGFGDVLLAKQPDAGRAVDRFLDRPPPTSTTLAPSVRVTVQVYNGTGTTGLAARTTSNLRALGWGAVTAGNEPRSSRTLVRYPPGQQAAARALAGRLTGPVQLIADPALATGTLRLVLGTSYQGTRDTAPTTTTPRSSTTAPPTTGGSPRDFDPRPC